MRNIGSQIIGIAWRELVRHTIDNQSHLSFQNVDDLLLRMRMRGHFASSRQRRQHLIHRLAMRYRPARNAGTNLNCRVFSIHSQIYADKERPSKSVNQAMTEADITQ